MLDAPRQNTKDLVPATRRNSRYYTQIEPIMSDPVIRGYFTLVASFLLTAFFILFALSPTFSTIVGLLRKIDDQKKVIAALDSKITNLITAQENYSQVEQKLPLLEAALPTRPLPDEVLTELVKSGSASGVKITSLQVDEVYLSGINPVKVGEAGAATTPVQTQQDFFSTLGLPTVKFTLGVNGTKDQIRSFAGYIVNLPRILLLDELTVTSETGSIDGGGNMNAEISGSGFFYPNLKDKKVKL